MTQAQDPWQPDLGDRVSRLEKFKFANAPSPVFARIEQLCDLVDAADGIRPQRQELMAALIYAAPADGKKLARLWQRYRTAAVHRVVLNTSATTGPIDLRGYRRG